MRKLYIDGVGVRGPGITDWNGLRAILTGGDYSGGATPLLPPEQLPPAERRRTVPTVRLAIAVGMEAASHAGVSPAGLASVFTSSGGDGETVHDILETLASDAREVSPTRFHNSVHNAASGYWGIATGATAPASSLCAYDWSFAAGLLEVATQIEADGQPALLAAYDLPYPMPLASIRHIEGVFGLGLVIAAAPSAHTLARIALSLENMVQPATPCRDARLEVLRAGNPAARSLPLLEALATSTPATIALDYLGDMTLTLELTPVATR